MNYLPRQQLYKLIATYGRSLCDDPRRCEALLKDTCGQYRPEIAVLVGALREGVAAELLASQNSVPQTVLLARLTKRLHDNLALTEDAARWGVESWALALGVISTPDDPYRPQMSVPNAISSEYQPPSVQPQYRQEIPAQSSLAVPNPSWNVQPQASGYFQSDSFQAEVKTREYAGFWKRFLAYILDGIILYIFVSVIGFIIGITYGVAGGTAEGARVLSFLLSLILGWLYFGLMESSVRQATLGKQALGIIVTDLNGNRIFFGKATARYFGKFISGLILGIGYIMAGFTEKKQALHDMMAGCLVVKK